MTRPKPPTKFDLTPESYYEHNRYFNEAEKIFDALLEMAYEECPSDNCENCYEPLAKIPHLESCPEGKIKILLGVEK